MNSISMSIGIRHAPVLKRYRPLTIDTQQHRNEFLSMGYNSQGALVRSRAPAPAHTQTFLFSHKHTFFNVREFYASLNPFLSLFPFSFEFHFCLLISTYLFVTSSPLNVHYAPIAFHFTHSKPKWIAFVLN